MLCEWVANLTLPEKMTILAEKQAEQVNFDINKVYEVFKSEQFKHGYTRKDEPRMRKEFLLNAVMIQCNAKRLHRQIKQLNVSILK